jgi:glyoxylase-like metal-dependent hydrolase (beta-lactamase superfamily II)
MFKIISTGFFHADGGAMFGAIPKVTWSRSYPADDRNLCVLAMHAGIVKTSSGRVIIIDPGVGQDQLKETPAIYYHFFDTVDIYDALKKADIQPEDVTDVVFTHLHFDHCSAAVRKNEAGIYVPSFPKALHWISRAQYENEQKPHPLEAGSFVPQNTSVLDKAGLLRIVEATIEPYKDVVMELFDGHTRGQICIRIKHDDDMPAILFPGDVIPLSSQIVPERISAYDYFPTLSYDGKIKILEKAAADKNIIVFYHDTYIPCATIRKVGNSFKIDKKTGF